MRSDRPDPRFTARYVLLLIAVVVCPAALETQVVSDPALRAAYLFNFAKFIEWPTATGGPTPGLRVCSTDARVAAELVTLVGGKTIGGRPVTGARISADAGASTCSIVHAGGLNERDSKTLLDALGDLPVFTVGDSEQFTERGGAAHFYLDQGRLRFAVNLPVVRRTGLRVDPGLLQMARVIRAPAEAESR